MALELMLILRFSGELMLVNENLGENNICVVIIVVTLTLQIILARAMVVKIRSMVTMAEIRET